MNKRDISILIGNAMDHFDAALYGFLAPIIANIFFPQNEPNIALILSYSVFATSLITRPVGSYIFGIVARKYGEVSALSHSLIGVALFTMCIGIIPSHQQIGVFAPLLLLLVRIFQGIYAEGECTIAKLHILENKAGCEAFKASYLYQISTMLGIICASFISSVIINTGHAEYWRACFIFGGVTMLVGYFLRLDVIVSERKRCYRLPKKLKSSVIAKPSKRAVAIFFSLLDQIATSKLKFLLAMTRFLHYRNLFAMTRFLHYRNLFAITMKIQAIRHLGSFVVTANSDLKLIWSYRINIIRISFITGFSYLTYIIPFVVMNSFIPLITDISLGEMMISNTNLLIFDMLLISVVGYLTKKLPYIKILNGALIALTLTIIPLWTFLENASLWYVNFVRIFIIIVGVIFLCPLNCWLNSLFKVNSKYMLVGIGNSIGSSVFGRLTPAICLSLWHVTHSSLSIAIYITILAIGVLWSINYSFNH